MPTRRDILQGCLLAGISLAMPRLARSESTVTWTADWSVKPHDDGQLEVRVKVSPSADTQLLVDQLAPPSAGPASPHRLQVRVGDSAEVIEVTDINTMMARIGPRWQLKAIAKGESHTFGPWFVNAKPTDLLHLALTLTWGADQTTVLQHTTGKPEIKAEWEVLPAGRSAVQVRVALTSTRDTDVHLINGLPPGFRLQAGGRLSMPPGSQSASRAGPRRERYPLVAGTPTKLGGWLITPDADVLKVSLDLEHDGGLTHFEADLPIDRSGA